MPDIFNCLFKQSIKIIDFAPDTVYEYSNTKVIIIFESNYSFENLKLLENNIKIKLNNCFLSCKVLSKSSILFITPALEPQDASLEIFINGDKMYDNEIANNKLFIKISKNSYNIKIVYRIFTLKGTKSKK